jgi:hypothetical protein
MRPKPDSTVQPGGQRACTNSGTCKHKDNSPSGAQHEQETLGLEVVPAYRQYVAGRAAPREGPATACGSAAVINHPGQCAAHGERCHWAAVCGLGLHGHTADARLCCAWRAQAKVRKQQRRGASPWLSGAGRVVARLTTRRTVYAACQTA